MKNLFSALLFTIPAITYSNNQVIDNNICEAVSHVKHEVFSEFGTWDVTLAFTNEEGSFIDNSNLAPRGKCYSLKEFSVTSYNSKKFGLQLPARPSFDTAYTITLIENLGKTNNQFLNPTCTVLISSNRPGSGEQIQPVMFNFPSYYKCETSYNTTTGTIEIRVST